MQMSARKPNLSPARRRDIIVAFACGCVVAGMVGAAYAAVPFYNWFCRTTGYGGTTQVAEKAPGYVLDRKVTVRFDSNVTSGLPWRFEPERNTIEVRLGEVVTVYYKVINEAARDTWGQASYNVTPPTVGIYFTKINCFCFTEQHMKPGETRDMAVVFYVDPKLVKNSELDDLKTITLSYTFYAIKPPERPVAQSSPLVPAKAGTQDGGPKT
jgi:cytochrome c oxidase assembly protein subunit 11